jgi:2-polyprenyl-3-methyl-5-hydroxy-6-metoxy-1,4-benzoquinol methylase
LVRLTRPFSDLAAHESVALDALSAAGGHVVAPACNLCGSTQARPFLTCRTHVLVTCVGCGLVYATERLGAVELAEMYAHRYPPEAFLPQRERKLAKAHRELALLERLTTGRRLLDVGTSYGFFLVAARERGWSAVGVEIAPEPAEYARRIYGLDVRTGTLETVPLEPAGFDVVTIRHVLEHVPDPLGMLRRAVALVRPGGLILVAVPNLASLAFRLNGRYWWWIDPPTHLYYFTPRTLRAMLQRAGLEVVLAQSERSDDHPLLYTLLFSLNQRFRLGARLRRWRWPLGGHAGLDAPDEGRPAGPSRWGRHIWTAAQVLGEALDRLARPLAVVPQRLLLCSEVLMVAQRHRSSCETGRV